MNSATRQHVSRAGYPIVTQLLNNPFSRLISLVSLLFASYIAPTHALSTTDTYSSAGSYTWTAPSGVTSITVEAWGGGGAGGGATGRNAGGGGGAGGQYARSVIAVTPGNSYTVVVGAGGSGSTGNGANGGNSTFSTTLVVAVGGAGGGGAPNNNTGGSGATGSTTGGFGDTVYRGGNGGDGASTYSGGGGGGAGSGGAGGSASGTTPGTGTAVGGGDGGAGRTTGGSGIDGNVSGGGGGGGFANNNTNRSGGNGAEGRVSITYNLPPVVISINRASSNPTTANTSVSWTVLFTSSVTGVDIADFSLIQAGGTTGASITSVSGSGTSWTVTANTGTSTSGTLGLNLIDNDSIVDSSSTPLGGTGINNGNFTGQVYTLAPPAPTLGKTASASAAVVGDVVTFTITVTNPYSTPLTNVVVTDTLPAGMSHVTNVVTLGSTSVAGQVLTWTIPTLPASGGSAQMTLAVSLSQTGPLINTVTAPGATPASATILVLASAVTHFRMDEPVGSWTGAAGEVIDSGGTALHGRRLTSITPTTTNVVDPSPTIASQHASVIGGFCNAGSFDRRAIVEVADSALFDYTTQLSASAWIYPTAYPPSGGLYSILSNDVNYEFHLNPQGKLFWWWNASTLTSATTIPLNQWTHVAITFDSSAGVRRQRIYINGVLDSNTNNWQGTLQPNNCNFYIGGDVATGAACSIIADRNFAGMIDEVKLYSFELNSSEVQADMNLGRSCSGVFDHVRLEHDGSGSICAPERVTVKACLNSDCTTLYPGIVTVNLSPTGWVGGSTFSFAGGIATRQLSVSTAGSVTLGTNSVSPIPGQATRCFNGATETCTINFASASCAFDAVEQGALPQSPIYTKLSGVSFNIDVLALINATTINTGYTGTVAVDLVDASSSSCPTGAGLNTSTNISFIAADSGRKTVTFNYPSAARNVKVRAIVGASAPACSTDNFAIRPQAFTVSSTNANNTNTSGTPVITAGAPFNLTSSSVAGYNGTPLLDNSKVIGTPTAGTLTGTFNTASAASGSAIGNSFSYSEVGNFGLNAAAVYDSTFTAVDQPGDCNAGFSNTLVSGKYGCSIGSNPVSVVTGSSGFGRFIPASFVIDHTHSPACSGAFTYAGLATPARSGQPFAVSNGTVTAKNLAGNTTTNYAGSYVKLAPAGITATPREGGAAANGALTWGVDTLSFAAGVGSFSENDARYAFNAEGVPQNMHLRITATDSDGVTGSQDDASKSVEYRFGRVRLQNAYGPELLALSVPFQSEYLSAVGYVVNSADGCTAPTLAGHLQLSNPATAGGVWQPGTTAMTIGGGTTSASLANTPFLGGIGGLSFSAPGAGNTGYVDIRTQFATDLTWLLYDWDGDGAFDDEATARANFGLYKGSNTQIYLRERY